MYSVANAIPVCVIFLAFCITHRNPFTGFIWFTSQKCFRIVHSHGLFTHDFISAFWLIQLPIVLYYTQSGNRFIVLYSFRTLSDYVLHSLCIHRSYPYLEVTCLVSNGGGHCLLQCIQAKVIANGWMPTDATFSYPGLGRVFKFTMCHPFDLFTNSPYWNDNEAAPANVWFFFISNKFNGLIFNIEYMLHYYLSLNTIIIFVC